MATNIWEALQSLAIKKDDGKVEDVNIFSNDTNIFKPLLNMDVFKFTNPFEQLAPRTDDTTSVKTPSRMETVMSTSSNSTGQTKANGTTIEIKDDKGNVIERRSGGNKNWRNYNPGNIRYNNSSAKWLGAIGKDADGFAIFSSMDAGYAAAHKLLSNSPRYKGKTLWDIVGVWAPKNDGNNVTAYRNFMQKAGFDLTKTYASLDPAEQRRWNETKMKMEGGKVGRSLKFG